ncbi:hypothetical protein BALOs_2085 [Halobacteriovorax sp. BALOs_7]|uniref:hypothetical protein n=1 Tax=Halobacteriovorax sp. BALOs_7 TaxID=2109558 RepID=UPI000EA09869|nr:hypothetical protein [Halobacteriovorax sp. BALOs_7]AYF45084.1 hypothetical protein BALOs_2085 [Halobacteriovorax sp. BALOs_7]
MTKILFKIMAITMVATFTQADFNRSILFSGRLANSCEFVSDQAVLEVVDSLTIAIKDIKDERYRCQSIYANSKAFLSSLSEQYKGNANEVSIIDSNLETIASEVYQLVANSNYNGEYDAEILSLQRRRNEILDSDYRKENGVVDSLTMATTILDDLRDAPECDDDLGPKMLRPAVMLMGQVAGALYPGSSLFTSAASTGLANMVDSLVSYVSYKGSDAYQALEDLYNDRNYYVSYKCAYKNINAMTCNLRRKNATREEAKWLYDYIQRLDTPDKDFQRIKDLRKHYPRIQRILSELRDIYETANQQDTIVTIATLQKEQAKLRLQQPDPYQIEEWNDEYQNIKTWGTWSQTLTWFANVNTKLNVYCREFQDGKYWVNQNSDCQENQIARNEDRTQYIQEVIKPALADLAADKERLSEKLRNSVNVERLYKIIEAEDNWRDNKKDYSISEVIEIFEEDLTKTGTRPQATALFSVRMRNALKALKALVNFEKVVVNVPSLTPEDCDIDAPNCQCNSFKDLSQAAYTYLANNLSDGDVLSVETIDATFYNYIRAVEEYFLYGLPYAESPQLTYEDSLNYSKYTFLIPIYRGIQQNLLRGDNVGASNIPLMNTARESFEKVFGKSIIKILNKNAKKVLKKGKRHDSYRDTLHSCAIYYPMLKKKGMGLRAKFLAKRCAEILDDSGGIPYLVNGSERFSTRNEAYESQCFYRNYEEAVSVKKAELARELDQNGDLPEL